MYPVLFRIFDVPVASYAAMMILGYLVSLGVLFFIHARAKETGIEGLDRAQMWDLYIVMIVSSVIGSKIGHTLFEAPGHVTEDGTKITSLWELLKHDPWHWMRLGEGGYVWYGGLIAALVTAIFYFRKGPKLNAWLYADAFAPAIMAGAVVGRLGCFLAGCCYGKETDAALGVLFPKMSHAVHPTQLYDAAIALVLGVGLTFGFFKRRFDGQNISIMLIAYSILRAGTEAFRGDADRGYFGPLSTSQWISVLLLVTSVALYWKLKSRYDDAIAK